MGVLGVARIANGKTGAGIVYLTLCLFTLILLLLVLRFLRREEVERISTLGYPMVVVGFIFGATALFFLDGGMASGVPALFILALAMTPRFLKSGEGLVMLCVEIVAYLTNIYLVFKYPDPAAGLIIPTDGGFFLLPLLLVGMILGGMTFISVYTYRRQQDVLDKALLDANSANSAKSTFLDNMSHEIRTPMNSILGMNEMILREEDRPEIREYALTIQRAGRALLGIINDILDFSKIQDNQMEISSTHYDLSSLVNDMVNIGAEQARRKSLTFDVNIDKAIPRMLNGDEYHLRQVLLNILSNAVKFTERGGVTLSLGYEKVDNATVLLKCSIADTGIGIKEEDMEYIFKPFEHIGATRNLRSDGSGLGLTIVKSLLQLMHSDLKVESTYHKGSTFSFELPQTVTKWEPIGDYNRVFSVSNLHHSAYREAFQAPDARVLVVDDAEVNLLVFANLLKKTRIQIDTAGSGAEMLQMVRINPYDMIFLDHRMPGMDGIEAFHAMKNIPDSPNAETPVIAFTANAVLGARQMYLDEGFNDYISKPVDTVRLEQLLLSYLPPAKIRTGDQMDLAEPEPVKANAKTPAPEIKERVYTPEPEPEEEESPYAHIPGIDYEAAVTNCGAEETFVAALQIFYDTLDQKASDIEKFEKEKDFKNYTILVHALKSASRLVGALKLSADAKYLEDCGNAGNAAEIEAKTPDLLSLYRSYKEALAPIFGKNEDDSSLPEIPLDDLHEMYGLIKSFAQNFDLDSIDRMLEEVKGFRIPDAEKEKFGKIKDCVTAADWGTLEQLLS
jgi:signal transduction histidine kinase/ActR/RegA family two-component response regulator/HPt (histidine-containing phosphotransfer) domain-containing protein